MVNSSGGKTSGGKTSGGKFQCFPSQITAFGLLPLGEQLSFILKDNFPLRRSVKLRQRPLLGCIFSLNTPRILYGFKVITVAWGVEFS